MTRPNTYDPAKLPGNKSYDQYHGSVADSTADALGPAGRTTNLEHDEKGILESGVFEAMSMHQRADLGSSHDPFREGIYKTNSVGDQD